MCEHCRTTKVSGEPIPWGKEFLDCEYIPDPEEEGDEICLQRASVMVSVYSCHTHLCEEHMRELNEQLDQGLGDVLRTVGLGRSTDFAPIKEPAKCEHIGAEGLLTDEIQECGNPAAHAEMVWEENAYCAGHAETPGESTE